MENYLHIFNLFNKSNESIFPLGEPDKQFCDMICDEANVYNFCVEFPIANNGGRGRVRYNRKQREFFLEVENVGITNT